MKINNVPGAPLLPAPRLADTQYVTAPNSDGHHNWPASASAEWVEHTVRPRAAPTHEGGVKHEAGRACDVVLEGRVSGGGVQGVGPDLNRHDTV